MRILVIDDHVIVRKGVRSIIEDEITNPTVGEAGSAREALACFKKQRWDVVILDLNLPGQSGFELIKTLHQLRPDQPVLVLSVHPERQYALRALKLGAAGYLCKDIVAQELVKALRRLAQGGKYLTETLTEALAQEYMNGATSNKPSHELLSQREYEILLLIAAGQTVSVIADQLALSVKTISTYRARVLEKMNLTTNAEITRYAFENGLMETLK